MSMTMIGTLIAPLMLATAPPEFETPVRIQGGDDKFDKILYPSPVLHDIDGDGKREMVIGDLPGYIRICEPTDSGWTKPEQLDVDGKPLKLHNW